MRATVFALMMTLAACGGGEKKAEAPPPPPPPVAVPAVDPAVAQALDLAEAIRANPAGADQVLTAKGMTQAQLDDLMYKVAADPKLAEAYEKGAGK